MVPTKILQKQPSEKKTLHQNVTQNDSSREVGATKQRHQNQRSNAMRETPHNNTRRMDAFHEERKIPTQGLSSAPVSTRRWESIPKETIVTPQEIKHAKDILPIQVETKKSKQVRSIPNARVPTAAVNLADFVTIKPSKAKKSDKKDIKSGHRPPPPPSTISSSTVQVDTGKPKSSKKKRLSTLKKIVTRDRKAKWEEFHAKKVTISSDVVAESNLVDNRSIQAYHLVDPEEVEDDDEYEDTISHVREQFSAHGEIESLFIDRETGCITVEYHESKDANAAVAFFDNTKFGGQTVRCVFLNMTTVKSSFELKIYDYCDPAELEDPDEYEEVSDDVQSTFCKPHEPTDVSIEKDSGIITLSFDSLLKAMEMASTYDKKTFGGKTIRAVWLDENNTPKSTPPEEVNEIPPVRRLPNATAIREYVNQKIDIGGELESLVMAFLSRLMTFQERSRLTNPLKAKKSRRLVFGLREVKRGLKNGKVMCLLVAYNIEECAAEGGLDDKVMELIDLARSLKISVIFSLSKRKLGKALLKSIRVSCVGIYNIDGAHEMWSELKTKVNSLQNDLTIEDSIQEA